VRRATLRKPISRRGFTLIELLVTIFILSVLLALLLPAVQSAREAARRIECQNNLKQLGIALHNYHDVHAAFPIQLGGTSGGSDTDSNQDCLSAFVGLLPFLEQAPLYDQISSPGTLEPPVLTPVPSFGPVPWHATYAPWKSRVAGFYCPSDPDIPDPSGNNYRFCIGTVVAKNEAPSRQRLGGTSFALMNGLFVNGISTRIGSVTDGLSNTIAMSERGKGGDLRSVVGRITVTPLPVSTRPANNSPAELNAAAQVCLSKASGRIYNPGQTVVTMSDPGSRWPDGRPYFTSITTLLPPNSAACTIRNQEWQWGIWTPSSHHPGMALVLLGDGSVRPAHDTVDRTVFQAAGTISGGEVAADL
jgi:prepilin-type N-terminal cleavage/methylation domain-containing protein